ncbi:tRNA (adenosine(37)-N6)-threonylcarbamoyltransferase complex ATPase subunit type 1 TsaE [Halobacteriovorax marinus]|uniref:tRNA threonylcarbamoyladenosine biosynthesis protein TsaE n=1 Tax=Halobacteriovorax marinus TaxID=97084 RepID=A0A1Y5FD86_9BACT|nr:tRNA (adenosine(37)-N6)-threonylcarbamoyltransferase complex ATPase subunit type 1 TsaE [Halobacteriovorax marinus]
MKEVRVWENVHESDLVKVVSELKDSLQTPCVVLLSGPVGAGKTTLTKKFIGGEDEVCSPTYSIINESNDCAHGDFYRLESSEEVVHLELSLYLEDKNYFLIEWGKPFLKEIQRNIEEDWQVFELLFEINPNQSNDSSVSTRKLTLTEIL